MPTRFVYQLREQMSQRATTSPTACQYLIYGPDTQHAASSVETMLTRVSCLVVAPDPNTQRARASGSKRRCRTAADSKTIDSTGLLLWTDTHLRVIVDCPWQAMYIELADVLVRHDALPDRRATGWTQETFDQYPGCVVAAAATWSRGGLIAVRDNPVAVSVLRPDQPAPSGALVAFASLIHGLHTNGWTCA